MQCRFTLIKHPNCKLGIKYLHQEHFLVAVYSTIFLQGFTLCTAQTTVAFRPYKRLIQNNLNYSLNKTNHHTVIQTQSGQYQLRSETLLQTASKYVLLLDVEAGWILTIV